MFCFFHIGWDAQNKSAQLDHCLYRGNLKQVFLLCIPKQKCIGLCAVPACPSVCHDGVKKELFLSVPVYAMMALRKSSGEKTQVATWATGLAHCLYRGNLKKVFPLCILAVLVS